MRAFQPEQIWGFCTLALLRLNTRSVFFDVGAYNFDTGEPDIETILRRADLIGA